MVVPHVAQGGIKTAYVMVRDPARTAQHYTDALPSAQSRTTYHFHESGSRLQSRATTTSTRYGMAHDAVSTSRHYSGSDQRSRQSWYQRSVYAQEPISTCRTDPWIGVKSYPRGVTTNSSSGIEDYSVYYPVFKAMEEEKMVLNLHGEVPSDPEQNISILNAEKHFLKHLRKLAQDFPSLRIVLEHATTAEAIETVKSLPDNVACTITAHHLWLTIDTVAPQPHHFCKPLAKEPKDRQALQDAIFSGNPKFFLGSDSAPHPTSSKQPNVQEEAEPSPCAAGVYTSPILIPLVATLLESFGALDKLEGYVSEHGREFYGIPAEKGQNVKLRRTSGGQKVPGLLRGEGGIEVVPFWAGKDLGWEIA